MSRKVRGRSGYKPLSPSFCKSVLKEMVLKNKAGDASIKKSQDRFTIHKNKKVYTVYRTDPVKYQIIELLHAGFEKDILVSFCEFTEKEILDVVPKLYKSFDDFLFVLQKIPDMDCEEVLNTLYNMKGILESNSKSCICNQYNLTGSDYIRMLTIFDIKVSEESVVVTEEIDVESEKKDVKSIKKGVDLSEYENFLGLSNVVINYDCLLDEFKKGNSYCYERISEDVSKNELIYYIFKNKYHCFDYSCPFYPAEDKILEKFYRFIGIRVVEVMESVIPNYVRREDWEYLSRIRECKYKTPHPVNGFEVFKEDLSWIEIMYNSVKKSPTKYFFWLDNYDLQYYAKEMGFTVKKSKKEKDILDLQSIDLRGYVSEAEKFKEVIYFDTFWTSERHNLFKQLYSQSGLSVMEQITGLTVEMCREHSSQFRIYQNYTTEEVNRMKEVYFSEGLKGLVEKFPYRSYDGLKYKIEDEGWDKLLEEDKTSSVSQEELERLVQERVNKERESLRAELKEEVLQDLYRDMENNSPNTLLEDIKKSILKDEVNRIRKKVRSDEAAKIEEEARTRMKRTVEKEVEKEFKQNVYPKLKQEVSLDVRRDLISEIESLSDDSLQESLFGILNDMSLLDIYRELPKSIKQSFVKLLKSTVLS